MLNSNGLLPEIDKDIAIGIVLIIFGFLLYLISASVFDALDEIWFLRRRIYALEIERRERAHDESQYPTETTYVGKGS